MDGNRAILHALPVPALVVGTDGTVLACNPAGAACFGENGASVVGKNFNELDLSIRDHAVRDAFARAGGTGEAQHVLSLAADRRWWKLHFGVLLGRQEDAAIIVTAESLPTEGDWADEVRRLREELNERLHELHAARRTDEERKNFLAMLAHELRNPLAAVASAVRILRARRVAREDGLAAQALRVAERQIRNQTRMLEDLLAASRVVLGKIDLRRQVLDLSGVVRQATEGVNDALRMRAQHLELALPPEPVWVEGDETRLEQIFANLLGNAVKFTPPGGQIRVTVEARGEWADIRVRDDGIGIEPDLLGKIFDLFTQGDTSTSRSAGGLGVGLTLAQRLAEMHGGTIVVRSGGRGHGSEFEVTLPRAVGSRETATTSAETPTASAETPPRAGRSILVVDDNRDAREMLRTLLELEGHRVETASDGRQAVKLAVEGAPEVALVDIGLPGMDGYEVARQIRRRLGDAITLVALTGYGDEEAQRLAREAGFGEHFVKPVDVDRLTRFLSAA